MLALSISKKPSTIWNEGLLHRHLSYGIGGKMFKLVEDLYSKSSCAIKIDNYRTSFLRYLRGVI